VVFTTNLETKSWVKLLSDIAMLFSAICITNIRRWVFVGATWIVIGGLVASAFSIILEALI